MYSDECVNGIKRITVQRCPDHKAPKGWRKILSWELKTRIDKILDIIYDGENKVRHFGLYEGDMTFSNAKKLRYSFRQQKVSRFIVRPLLQGEKKPDVYILIQKDGPSVAQEALPRMNLSFIQTHEFIRNLLQNIFEGSITHVILSLIYFSTGTYETHDLQVYLNFETKKYAVQDNRRLRRNGPLSHRQMWGSFTFEDCKQREYCKTPDSGLQLSIKLIVERESVQDLPDTFHPLNIALRWLPSYGLQFTNIESYAGWVSSHQCKHSFLLWKRFECTLDFQDAKALGMNKRAFSAIDWIMS